MSTEPAPEMSERARRHAARRARRRRRRRLRRLAFAAMVVTVVVGALAYAPARRALRRARVQNLVTQAAQLLREQSPTDAVERLKEALDLDPADRNALRALAEVYTRRGLPAALPLWERLMRLPGAADRDAHDYLRAALDLGRFDLAETDLARLLSQTNSPQETRVLATDFYLRQGDPTRAFEFAEEARKADPTNELHQLRSARVLLAMPDPDRKREGLARLGALSQPTPDLRLRVLELLRQAPDLPPAETLALLDRWKGTQDVPFAEDLARTDLLVRLEPGRRAELISAVVRRHRLGSPEAQAALVTWLNRIGAQTELLAAYQREEALRQPAVLPAYYEALALSGRWTELQAATAGTPALEPAILDAFRTAVAVHLGQEELAREHWRRALDRAQDNPDRIQGLGELLVRLDCLPQALDAYDRLTRMPIYRATGYRLLAEAYRQARDAERLRTLMTEWASFAGDDPGPENAFCYLSALLRKDFVRAERRATALVERFPPQIGYRATLAFVLLRRGEAAAALDLFQRARADVSQASPETRLIYAATLDANDQHERALAIVRQLPRGDLLPEELEIVRRIDPQ